MNPFDWSGLIGQSGFRGLPVGDTMAHRQHAVTSRMHGALNAALLESRAAGPRDTEGLINPAVFGEKLALHGAELDVVQVGPPPTRTRAADL